MATNAMVSTVAREMGLPKRINWAEACAHYVAGWSTTEIAIQCAVTAATINWGIKKRGVIMRTPAETMAMQAARGGRFHSPRCGCGLVLRNLRVVHETPEGEAICDMCWHRREHIPWVVDENFFKEATDG